MEKVNKPSYYSIIPATVRYDKNLKYSERLLYGEITSLIGKEGYCFANNGYFAGLYDVATGTISRWISHLEKGGYIKVEVIRDSNNAVVERRIFITDVSNRTSVYDTYIPNNQYPYVLNRQYPIDQNVKDNNKIDRFFNYIIKREDEKIKSMSKSELEEFYKILDKLELSYTEEMLHIFTKETLEKIKIIIYSIRKLYINNQKMLLYKVTRYKLFIIYDKCKVKQAEYIGTQNEINNFLEYYYSSLINEYEKAL